ncbi:DUF1853 family protein [Xanthomarina spongicola]|uniref:DUF1853 family protein n=1 Tax=Xanthomarina spongicola TaxID=570520 RepID=A0A316DQX3_9FLAO|nr:DUF1853 family protein [Xanthomarina spongicola]PWK19858.1 hypothetical protein LX78_01208 [Xanthomarina spongicola]
MNSNLNLQYQGYLKTPNLWNGHLVYNLQQLECISEINSSFNETLPKNIRLGKRVEQFVFHELKQLPQISILAENLQIQQEKRTLGEMDMLLLMDNKPIHLEIIYKFYVYDDTVGTTQLDHWIGPNRKDSLVEKLNKLKNKQLPLLYLPETLTYLQKHNLEIEKIEQNVLFKAQLFVPYNIKTIDFKPINPACIAGFYLKKETLIAFDNCKFYIPSKANWLLETQVQSNWMTYDTFLIKVHLILEKQTSPLVWIKHPNGEINKCFIVWW